MNLPGLRTPFRALLLAVVGLALLGAAGLSAGELTVTLTDGTRDDVVATTEELVPQAPLDGYVQWVATITGPPQQVAVKAILGDCMQLMAGTEAMSIEVGDGIVVPRRDDPLAHMRYVGYSGPQRNVVVTVEGNSLLVENLRIPSDGVLTITYWARVAGLSHRNPEPLRPVVLGTTTADAGPLRRGLTEQPLPVARGRGELGKVLTYNLPTPVEPGEGSLPIETNVCCHQALVVDQDVFLHRSQPEADRTPLCPAGETGFFVAVPGAPVPVSQ